MFHFLLKDKKKEGTIVKKIRLAIAGVGNCASALIQGIEYYKATQTREGLLFPEIGGYRPQDIEVVAAFDIDERKVGKDISEAIWAPPNNTEKLFEVPYKNVEVMMGPVFDGVPSHLAKYVKPASKEPVKVGEILKRVEADVLINLIPTGSSEASKYYATEAIKAGVAFVNGIPELLVSEDKEIEHLALEYKVPLIGDDFKSQIGATIVNRALIKLFLDRGVKLDSCYQLNYAGNTDFVNLVFRGETKHITKSSALKSLLPYDTEISTAFAYVSCQRDRKIARIELKGRKWGGAQVRLSVELDVNDSADAAGVMVDMIRCAKLAKDRGIAGRLISPSAYYAKHPPIQFPDEEAKRMLEEFIKGERER